MGAKEMGAEVEFIQLQNLHIEHCTGCTACVQSVLGGRGGKCVLKDDLTGCWTRCWTPTALSSPPPS